MSNLLLECRVLLPHEITKWDANAPKAQPWAEAKPRGRRYYWKRWNAWKNFTLGGYIKTYISLGFHVKSVKKKFIECYHMDHLWNIVLKEQIFFWSRFPKCRRCEWNAGWTLLGTFKMSHRVHHVLLPNLRIPGLGMHLMVPRTLAQHWLTCYLSFIRNFLWEITSDLRRINSKFPKPCLLIHRNNSLLFSIPLTPWIIQVNKRRQEENALSQTDGFFKLRFSSGC